MKRTLFFLLLFSALQSAVRENEIKYVWPLTISNGISSTFQEFRSNHFHAGIDLRTFKTTGFPVRAVTDGVIEKIIVGKYRDRSGGFYPPQRRQAFHLRAP